MHTNHKFVGDEPQDLENEESDSESENETTELILVPTDDNSTSISSIYEAIKLCQVRIITQKH